MLLAATVTPFRFAAGQSQAPLPATLTKIWDVAVIGAGAFGAWSAYFLRKAGLRVILLDAYGPAKQPGQLRRRIENYPHRLWLRRDRSWRSLGKIVHRGVQAEYLPPRLVINMRRFSVFNFVDRAFTGKLVQRRWESRTEH